MKTHKKFLLWCGYKVIEKKKSVYKALWLQIPRTHFKLPEAKAVYCEGHCVLTAITWGVAKEKNSFQLGIHPELGLLKDIDKEK